MNVSRRFEETMLPVALSATAVNLRPAGAGDAVAVCRLHQSVISAFFPERMEAAKVAALYPLSFWKARIALSRPPLPPLRDLQATAKLYPYGSYECSPYGHALGSHQEVERHVFRVACHGVNVIGFSMLDASLVPQPRASFYVDARWQRLGVGRLLFAELLGAARQREIPLVQFEVLEPAVGFFLKMGCEPVPHALVRTLPLVETLSVQVQTMQTNL